MVDGEPQHKQSDLKVRAASAVVMVTGAGLAIWLGGWLWLALVGAVAVGVLWEWRGLVARFAPSALSRAAWMLGGFVYIGLAAGLLALLRVMPGPGQAAVLPIMLAVIGTDVGAYFAGRTFGGPKIAPKVSPSKTWSGLGGGILGATLVWLVALDAAHNGFDHAPALPERLAANVWPALMIGTLTAVIAQAGDFFESWMKRRAGVKDSGRLIPGHGGLFDRVDGLLAVLFVLALASLVPFFAVP
ncbi:MAG: hypothetical protein RLZZ84_973 [Pseudomonadota bacterium]|jgi:phosphatidate cytidylyltransferase